MNFKIGQLITWIEEYSDGIVRDTGTGVIIERNCTSLHQNSFKVYRTKSKDFVWFSEYQLHSIGQKE